MPDTDMAPARRVLVLGADGFIGRHIAFHFRSQGWQVTACARRPARLARMGFEVLRVDLTSREAAVPAFWRPHLIGISAVVNSAGILTGSGNSFEAVHVAAPAALYAACEPGCRVLLLSAVGIDQAQTDFARYRRNGEAVAQAAGGTILRAGLVLGETSYGGSSLARALSALPFVLPTVGPGDQSFNPIHAADLAQVIEESLTPPPGTYEIGGPERVTQHQMLTAYRRWFGLAPAWNLPLPLPLCRVFGAVGDAMRLGPISRTAVAQLTVGVEAVANLPSACCRPPRGFSSFLNARPAGTQDLWHARLYLMRPVLRIVLAILWLASGLIGLSLPPADFLPLIPDSPLPDIWLIALARGGGLVDLLIAVALLRGWRPRLIAGVQGLMVAGYTLGFSLLAPALWALPLGGLLKNLPILTLIALAASLEEER